MHELTKKHDYVDSTSTVGNLSRPSILFLADCVSFFSAVLAAVCLAMTVRYYLFGAPQPPVPSDANRILIVFGVAFVILIFRSTTLGHYTQFRPFWIELKEVIKTVGLIAAFDAFLLFAIGVQFSRLWFGFFLVLLCLFVPYGREQVKQWMIRKGIWYQPTYIVGIGSSAKRAAEALRSDSSLGHKVCGFISLQKSKNSQTHIENIEVFESVDQAVDISGQQTSLVFAFETIEEMDVHRDLINKTIANSVQVTIVPPELGLPLYGATVVGIFRHDSALLKLNNRLADRSAQLVKRIVDVIFGTFFLVLFSPVFLVLAVLITRDGGPVFYNHRRLGKHGEHFMCHKFRSMRVDAENILNQHLANNPDADTTWSVSRKLKKDPRVTRIGHYLRRTSVDELPQLVNVIKGEMSLVGPRPIVDEEVHHYGSYISYYLTLTPGMTGLWQVSGRTDTTYQERVRLDVWYCKNWTLWNDVVVLIKTCKTLINRHGAY